MNPVWSNLLTTLISCAFTGALSFYTARLTARVQQQAANSTATSSESERAWKRVDKTEGDADHWREKWLTEHDLRKDLETEIRLLKAQIETLERATSTPTT